MHRNQFILDCGSFRLCSFTDQPLREENTLGIEFARGIELSCFSKGVNKVRGSSKVMVTFTTTLDQFSAEMSNLYCCSYRLS